MNRAERRRLERIGIHAKEIDKVFTEAGDMLKEQGHELAMKTIKKLGGLENE